MFNIKSIDSLSHKYLNVIEDATDERNNGDGYWIYLKEPFYNPDLECRIIHEQKIKDCISILKRIVDFNYTK